MNLKKVLALAFAAVLSLSILTGCNKEAQTKGRGAPPVAIAPEDMPRSMDDLVSKLEAMPAEERMPYFESVMQTPQFQQMMGQQMNEQTAQKLQQLLKPNS